MNILLFTDAWFPQINGVVRTLDMVCRALRAEGDDVEVISPADFKTIPCPTYPEIRLALNASSAVRARLRREDFAAIHIATEGPIGYAAQRACTKLGLQFTTAYHTKFPEYVHARTKLPLSWLYRAVRWFHAKSSGVMVATPSLQAELKALGFHNLKQWSRGVDLSLFQTHAKHAVAELNALPRPIHGYVGRVAVEKNIEAFLSLNLTGSKLVVGDGPQLASLKKRFPDAMFVGAKSGTELAKHYAACDVFVFPSKTDTFGLVMLEALASGVPVAAYPVPGPVDVVGVDGTGVLAERSAPIGALNDDLELAIKHALDANPADCRAYANHFSWSNCAAVFRSHLVPARAHMPLRDKQPLEIIAQ
ncbi:MAG: glycosyltransferase family 1 protein [Pseudomonadota bacterium]